METTYSHQKNTNMFTIIAGIGLLFSCIFIINAANEKKNYDAVSSDKNTEITNKLGQQITTIKQTIQANEAIKNHKYEKALLLISGSKSEDYYNRGTIQTLLAYKNALQNSISGLEIAQTFIAQAQQNFTIAKKLSTSKTIHQAINNNESTVESLSSVIDIKICYDIGQNIITNMHEIEGIIHTIRGTLTEEEKYINKKIHSLENECYEKLNNILDTSKEQVAGLELEMKKNIQKYSSDFEDKIDNPLICIQTPYENILPSMIKGAQGLSQYQQLHRNTIQALKSDNKALITELCKQTKNDAQINQQIENSVQEMLEKIEQNKQENQEKQQQQKAGKESKYKDFFTEDEKKILKEIQKINQGRINNTLDIRSKGNYNAEKYINDMFNQFYGNTGDFINLHK